MKNLHLCLLRFIVIFAHCQLLIAYCSAQEYKLRLGSVVPQDSPWEKSLKEYTSFVDQKSGGKIKTRMYLGGQLGGEVEMVKSVALGTLEAGAFSNAAIAEALNIPELQAFELPFLFNSDEEADAVMDALFNYYSEILAKKGVILIQWGTNGWRNFGCKKTTITKPADMKGLKMRSQEADVYVNLYKALGATPVPIQTPEVLVALKTGMVDGFDQTPIFSVSTGWVTTVKSYSVTRHIYQPGAVIVSKKFMDKLPADMKSLVLSPDKRPEFTKKSRSVVRTEDSEVLSTIETNFGTKVIHLTDAQRAEFIKAVQPVYAVMEKIIGVKTMQMVRQEIEKYRKK
ncbi:MAG: TRAP transporter substrate-binding protein [Bacteroidetes bacterium]|nr:TRAP transporter substrate-binding protein [Bacteroidota bacterium]